MAALNTSPLYEEIPGVKADKSNVQYCINDNEAYGKLQTSNDVELKTNVCYERVQQMSGTEDANIMPKIPNTYEEIRDIVQS